MNFTGLSTTLNLLKDQAIARKEQIGFWLGRTVKPVCEKILMANPILLTVGLAATAIFSVCYIVHNYRKNSRLETQVRELNDTKVKEIQGLKSQVDGWKKASFNTDEKLKEEIAQNRALMTEAEVNLKNFKDEAQTVINSKDTELSNAILKIKNLTEIIKSKDKEIEKHVDDFNKLNLMFDGLESENASLLNIIKTLNESMDVSIPTETNFLSEILYEEENNLRQKDKDLILNKSVTYLFNRTLPKVNGFIAKLEDLIVKVNEDPNRLFSIQINRIDDWSDIVEEKSTNPSANPFAEKIEIGEEESQLAGSTLNFLTNSMCNGQRGLNLFDLKNLHAYYQKFQVAVTLAITEKPKQDLTLEDKLILAFESKKNLL